MRCNGITVLFDAAIHGEIRSGRSDSSARVSLNSVEEGPTFFGTPATSGGVTLAGPEAGEAVGLTHYHAGAALTFRNSFKTLEAWGFNGSAFQPVMTWIANATKGFVSIRKPDDSRGISLSYPSAESPRITVEVPSGTNNAGDDLEIGGGPGTGSGTPGVLAVVAATAGSSGATEQALNRVALFRGSDVILSVPLRIGSDVAGAGSIRLPNATQINARNAANTQNLTLVDSTAGDVVRVGGDGSHVSSVSLAAPVTVASFIEGTEQSAPPAPPANGYRIFAQDTNGKTELMVIFSSGAAQRLAIQP